VRPPAYSVRRSDRIEDRANTQFHRDFSRNRTAPLELPIARQGNTVALDEGVRGRQRRLVLVEPASGVLFGDLHGKTATARPGAIDAQGTSLAQKPTIQRHVRRAFGRATILIGCLQAGGPVKRHCLPHVLCAILCAYFMLRINASRAAETRFRGIADRARSWPNRRRTPSRRAVAQPCLESGGMFAVWSSSAAA